MKILCIPKQGTNEEMQHLIPVYGGEDLFIFKCPTCGETDKFILPDITGIYIDCDCGEKMNFMRSDGVIYCVYDCDGNKLLISETIR